MLGFRAVGACFGFLLVPVRAQRWQRGAEAQQVTQCLRMSGRAGRRRVRRATCPALSGSHARETAPRRVESECAEDGAELDAGEVHHYLTRVMYNRRNKFNPLWNQLVVAGTKDGKP